ncbi:MAG: aspartate-semialdehyde dehydrogenase [candidate division WOR-3 bacterium]|nr:MAG: aspartate-semialdehyde dehydrogenase [candidate division WOR-3 bacterium]
MKNIAVLGVDSLHGNELVRILEQRNYPAEEIYFMSASEEFGEPIVFKDRLIEVHREYDLFADQVDIVFCCLDKVRARAAVLEFKKKASVIDCSRAFSFAPDVKQVIPEVNPDTLTAHRTVIANPSPTTIQLLMATYPLHEEFRLRCLHGTAFAAVSDLGQDALRELSYEYEYLAVGNEVAKADDSFFPYKIGGNLIPQVGDFTGAGDTEDEAVLTKEVQSILNTEEIQLGITAVWVPVKRGSCMVVYAGFEDHITVKDARKILKKAPGVKIFDHDDEYPMPENVTGKDDVFVGRIRQDKVFENGLALWIATDNLRKGSALNAVQIAELLL